MTIGIIVFALLSALGIGVGIGIVIKKNQTVDFTVIDSESHSMVTTSQVIQGDKSIDSEAQKVISELHSLVERERNKVGGRTISDEPNKRVQNENNETYDAAF
jgi:hypothetical protein